MPPRAKACLSRASLLAAISTERRRPARARPNTIPSRRRTARVASVGRRNVRLSTRTVTGPARSLLPGPPGEPSALAVRASAASQLERVLVLVEGQRGHDPAPAAQPHLDGAQLAPADGMLPAEGQLRGTAWPGGQAPRPDRQAAHRLVETRGKGAGKRIDEGDRAAGAVPSGQHLRGCAPGDSCHGDSCSRRSEPRLDRTP